MKSEKWVGGCKWKCKEGVMVVLLVGFVRIGNWRCSGGGGARWRVAKVLF